MKKEYNEKSELNIIAKQSTFLMVGKFLGKFIALISTFLFAKLLGSEDYGLYLYLLSIINIFVIFSSLGLHTSLVSFIPKLKLEKNLSGIKSVINFSLLLTLIVSVAIVLNIILFRDTISSNLLRKNDLSFEIVVMAPLLIFYSLNNTFKGIFEGKRNANAIIYIDNLILPVSKLIFFIVLYFVGIHFYGLILSQYFAFILSVFISIYIIRKASLLDFSVWDGKLNYEIFKYSIPLFLNGFVGIFLHQIDNYMIGLFLDVKNIAVYNIAYKIGIFTNVFMLSFNSMFSPVISKLYYKGDIAQLQKLYRTITRWQLLLSLVFFNYVFTFKEEILSFFGNEYLNGSSVLVILSLTQVINASFGAVGKINIMTGNQKKSLYFNLTSAILNLLLNMLLIPRIGILGASIATFVSVLVVNILRLISVYVTIKISPFDVDYFKSYLVAILAFTVINLAFLFGLNNLILKFLLISISQLIFYLKFSINKVDKEIYNSLLKKISSLLKSN